MAKKKKKAVKRKVGPTASKAAPRVTREELRDSLFFTIGGEASLGFVEAHLPNTTKPVQEFVVSVFEKTPEVSRPTDGADDLRFSRELLVRYDSNNKPYKRVIGRIIDVLLHHRGFKTCSGGDVFYVLLDEAPSQSGCDPNDFRLVKPSKFGRWYDVNNNAGRKSVDNRLAQLRTDGLVSLPHKNGYVLTPDGERIFNGWPDLSEIPGLSLTLPPRPTP
jgi:hypothetical protein